MVYFLTSLTARTIATVALLLSCWAGAVGATDASATAAAKVDEFHQTLIQALQLNEHEQREALLRPLIIELFDTGRIAAISLGRTWRSLTEEQQAAFIELLATLIVATYADRFDSYSGQRFANDGVEAVKSGFVVRTRLLRANEEEVSLHYLVRDERVFNVVADGVSDLSLRRADYSSVIKTQGYDALLDHISEKISVARSGQ
jgi:phospholipid transport system substrate-binding protein